MPEPQIIATESITPHLNLPQVEKLLMDGQRKFSGMNLDGLQLNELPMNFFAIDFSGASCVGTNFSNKTFTKTSFASADLSSGNFMATTFADNVTLDEAMIHGAAFYSAVAKEYGNEENTIEQQLSRCIVSSSSLTPHIHFSALDQETRHWILITRTDPNETFRALIHEYLKKNSGFLAFFSIEGRYRSLIALHMQTHPNETFEDFLVYLDSVIKTVPPQHYIERASRFLVLWYNAGRPDLINKLFGKTRDRREQPPLVAMIAHEVWRIFINKIKDWFAPEAAEPDEED